MEGIPIRHSIKILPKKDGIFTVNAVVSADAAGQSWSRLSPYRSSSGTLTGGARQAPEQRGDDQAGSVASRLAHSDPGIARSFTGKS